MFSESLFEAKPRLAALAFGQIADLPTLAFVAGWVAFLAAAEEIAEEALEHIRDAIEAPVKHKDLYETYGLSMPKGALLSGPPGCGKTMFARAAASELKQLYGKDVETILISGSEIQSPYVGVTEKHIINIFAYARAYREHHGHPLLVFIDEAEVLFPDRTGSTRRVASWEESQVATFLAEMDGVQDSGAFVLLATNRPEAIDQAVLRDGRCDFKIKIARPTQAAVEEILRRQFKDVPAQCDPAELVFAAVESLYDPHKIIFEARVAWADLKNNAGQIGLHFCLEHIVSGAMAASIPARAKRLAFSRDKTAGKVSGVTADDVIAAVGNIFEENMGLDHSFALTEFRLAFAADLKTKMADSAS